MARLHLRLQAHPLQLLLPARAAARERRARHRSIARIAPEGVVTADGELHELDCIIWATGFKTNDFMFPMEITGAGGRTLHEVWSGGAHAHLGMSVPDFPNMFVMYGPNTNTSGGSIIVYLEAQAAYIRQALSSCATRGAGAIDVRPEVEAASDRALQARFAGTAWTRLRLVVSRRGQRADRRQLAGLHARVP